MKGMRFAILLALVGACGPSQEELRARDNARLARWNATYAPYIKVACRESLETVQCQKARMEATKNFLDEEERDRREARDVESGRRTQRPRICAPVGLSLVCN